MRGHVDASDYDFGSRDNPDFLAAVNACMDDPPALDPTRKLPSSGMPVKLATVVTTFQRWLYLPDPTPLLGVLGVVAANLMPGDPVWLLLVGAPSGGKTELLQPIGVLPKVYITSTLTEAALLSATPARDKASDASGGLLRRIGDFGILLCKDFTSVLAMNRDSRACVLAALREIYDGSWTRHVGVDGGRTLHWGGKLGMIGACTSVIDSHHAVIASMGERFIMLRMPTVDEDKVASRALDHQGTESAMRKELERAVSGLFQAVSLPAPLPLDPSEKSRLVALATLAVRCRSAVERDSHTREVELIPEPEGPGRLTGALSRLLAGVSAIGASRAEAWRVVAKVALDCLPALRLRVIRTLGGAVRPLDTTEIAKAVQYPTQTTRRALEDLTAHGVSRRRTHGQGRADTWELSEWTRQKFAAADITFPELSGDEPDEDEEGAVPELSGGANGDRSQ